MQFKVGDRVKIEGVLEKRVSDKYPLKLTICPNNPLAISFNSKGEYNEDSGVILEMVEPAPEPLRVGDTRLNRDNTTKAVVLDIFEERVFYRYKPQALDDKWYGGSFDIESFLAAYPNNGD